MASARVEFAVQFSRGPKGRKRVAAEAATPVVVAQGTAKKAPARPIPSQTQIRASEVQPAAIPIPPVAPVASSIEAAPAASTPRVPKLTLLLVLAWHFESLVRDGKVKDYSEIARCTGLTRARVTQICNLTLLTPAIQSQILELRSDAPTVFERTLRDVTGLIEWQLQEKRFASHLA